MKYLFLTFLFISTFGSLSMAQVELTDRVMAYVDKLSVCQSVAMEKIFAPNHSNPFHDSDAITIKMGCLGSIPDTYYFVENHNPIRFKDELLFFKELVAVFKGRSKYIYQTQTYTQNQSTVERHLFIRQ